MPNIFTEASATVDDRHRFAADTKTRSRSSAVTRSPRPNVIVDQLDSTGAAGRCYVGVRGPVGCRVVVVDGADARPLRARTHDPLRSFSWGRGGAAARELAWSILFDSACDLGSADDWCTDFAAEVVSHLPREAFRMASYDVLIWLHEDRVTGGAACLTAIETSGSA
jgi:hypothetical protein